MRYFIELSYNGKAYHGWQNQPNAISVQEVLEKALSTLLSDSISIVGAGRTDAGVHAKQMFAHFDTDKTISDILVFKLNAFLPKDIAIHNIFIVKPEAHARFDAISRSYIYRVNTNKNAFSYDYSYYYKNKLDVEKMQKACDILFEYKDFQCFSRSNTDVRTYNCDIKSAKWSYVDGELQFEITADRFLRNMVRAIVGTLLEIGIGKTSLEEFHSLIKSKNRSNAGPSVPGHALYLTKIVYPESIKEANE